MKTITNIAITILAALLLVHCQSVDGSEATASSKQSTQQPQTPKGHVPEEPVVPADVPEGKKVATFAGGCFWCVEADFEKVEGVESAVSGYSGGEKEDPTYNEVAGGKTKYAESVELIYDPSVVTYKELLHEYWRMIDPTQANGQFVDIGPQYRPVIFYHNDRQKQLAKESKRDIEKNGPFDEPIVVRIQPATKFWRAKDYHQDFYKKSPDRYNSYREGSGRDQFIEKHWEDN